VVVNAAFRMLELKPTSVLCIHFAYLSNLRLRRKGSREKVTSRPPREQRVKEGGGPVFCIRPAMWTAFPPAAAQIQREWLGKVQT